MYYYILPLMIHSHIKCVRVNVSPPSQTVRHGFPYQPSSMAFDPVQKILAIGTQSGALRLYPLVRVCLVCIQVYPFFFSDGPQEHARKYLSNKPLVICVH